MERTCKWCDKTKDISEYSRLAQKLDGISNSCKECDSKRIAAWRVLNPDKVTAQSRRNNLRTNFGITTDEYDLMLIAQDGRCLICDGVCKSGRRLAVDHDRSCCPGKKSCGKCIRGLLCMLCNNGLGNFRDRQELLLEAANYVERYRK